MMIPSVFSLDMVRRRRAVIDQELGQVEKQIAEDFQTLFAPPEPGKNKMETLVNTATKAWFFVDGVLMGYKLLRRFGAVSRIFKSSKRKRK